ncbi:GGDEF domain-containing protein [Ancylobacter sp. 6x-1]|uniref:diguanylate cyclase n=1 Tax=Ancylobacter crimeensis TaxID=2579147 RepID=A0ABT0D6R5_9HYPH|nr:GGDEF domain-containing protein [Ancylobacter crimeensis]MCK0195643.1 GGDEF domain-containing protein [Ancylobacter crimeensis]
MTEESLSPPLDAVRFQLNVLERAMAIAAMAAGAVAVGGALVPTPIPVLQLVANAVFAGLSLLLLALVRRHPQQSRPLAMLFFAAALALVTLAAILVPADPLRFCWYFGAVGAAFLIFGTRGGVVTTLVAMAAAVLVFVVFDGLSALSLATLLCALAAASLTFATFSMQAHRFVRLAMEAANRDALTGLANRRFFEAALSSLEGAAAPFGMLMIDIDHFKTINDALGHDAGDQVLSRIAGLLAADARRGDVVARVGGEEFAVLLPGADPPAVLAVANRIREEIAAAALSYNGTALKVTVSVGAAIAAFPVRLGVQRRADDALYAAKRGGRNRVVLATD